TGLGLSTVYGIIRQSGGHIWVYSEPGRGTSFKLYLPRVDGSPTPLHYRVEAAATRGSETILVVEDDEALREMVVTMLTANGYEVLHAKTPEAALRVCRENADSIRMMLTAVVMPGMNGRELARRINTEWPDIRVLFMSGYTTNAIVHQGVLESGVEFLQKPFTAEILRERVRRILDGRGPSQDSGD
ncbi:MAG: response regulator, partial [Candidatus Acidiferrum sp.]